MLRRVLSQHLFGVMARYRSHRVVGGAQPQWPSLDLVDRGTTIDQVAPDNVCLGAVISEVNAVRRSVKTGDHVEKNQVLCTYEREKWTSDTHALLPGIVTALHVKEHEILSVDQPITINYLEDPPKQE